MTTKAHLRSNNVGLLSIGLVSAISMIWLFWRFPVGTGIATVVVLAAFALSARLARLIETDGVGSGVR